MIVIENQTLHVTHLLAVTNEQFAFSDLFKDNA